MAGRFLFQNLSSRITSGSRSLLRVRAHASASDVAASVCNVSEGGVETLTSFVHGSAAHPIPSNCVIHRYAARYYTLPWTCSVAKKSNPTSGMATVAAHHAKPAFVNPAGVKRTFSSKDTITREAEHAAEVEAKRKALNDGFKAWKTKLDNVFIVDTNLRSRGKGSLRENLKRSNSNKG